MARRTGREREGERLILGHLERVSSKVFSDFQSQLTDLVGKRHGVYALYKGEKLYYVGLATNLRRRIKHHLADKHAGKWDRFSLYLIRKAHDIQELESLILRIADPKGNAHRGGLPDAADLKSDLDAKIRTAQERQRKDVLGAGSRSRRTPSSGASGARAAGQTRKKDVPPLAPFVTKRFEIRLTRKGQTHKAVVRKDGTINYNGVIYNSPSIAGARAIGKKALNGWKAWKYRNVKGEWGYIDALRKGGSPKPAAGRKQTGTGKPTADLDTIICPAREDGFQETFLGQNCWYAIRLNASRIPQIRYIAAYRVAPIAAITHYAKVKDIKPHKRSGKFIVHFKGKAKKIRPIPSEGSRRGVQGPMFSSLKRLRAAKTLDDV